MSATARAGLVRRCGPAEESTPEATIPMRSGPTSTRPNTLARIDSVQTTTHGVGVCCHLRSHGIDHRRGRHDLALQTRKLCLHRARQPIDARFEGCQTLAELVNLAFEAAQTPDDGGQAVFTTADG